MTTHHKGRLYPRLQQPGWKFTLLSHTSAKPGELTRAGQYWTVVIVFIVFIARVHLDSIFIVLS